MAELVFFTGTMDCGKSTLALQTDHNHAARGRVGLVFTSRDRVGEATLSSRLGLAIPAVEVRHEMSLWDDVTDRLQAGRRIDYLIADEAQFYTAAQVDDMARIVDDLGIDVFAFGITTDFRTELFPGSRRLLELADRVHLLQVEALCWCGSRATHNARTVDGVMVVEGEQVVVGDTTDSGQRPPKIGYEVLCRAHHRRQVTAATARAAALSPDVLPFGESRDFGDDGGGIAPSGGDEVLVRTDWLITALAGDDPPTVLDVRWRLRGAAARDDYLSAHVPGSVFVDLDKDLAGPTDPTGAGGRHPLPTTSRFQEAMRGCGVGRHRRVVLLDDGDGVAAARAWWCLRYFGHDDVRILEGGWAGWLTGGGRTTAEVPVPERGDFVATPGGLPILDADQAGQLAGGEGTLVDVRSAERFAGIEEPIDKVAGHVPGSINLPAGLIVGGGRWTSAAEIREQLVARGWTGSAIGSSCGSGVTAAVLVASMARIGQPIALYAGSWSDWISDESRPVGRGEVGVSRVASTS